MAESVHCLRWGDALDTLVAGADTILAQLRSSRRPVELVLTLRADDGKRTLDTIWIDATHEHRSRALLEEQLGVAFDRAVPHFAGFVDIRGRAGLSKAVWSVDVTVGAPERPGDIRALRQQLAELTKENKRLLSAMLHMFGGAAGVIGAAGGVLHDMRGTPVQSEAKPGTSDLAAMAAALERAGVLDYVAQALGVCVPSSGV